MVPSVAAAFDLEKNDEMRKHKAIAAMQNKKSQINKRNGFMYSNTRPAVVSVIRTQVNSICTAAVMNQDRSRIQLAKPIICIVSRSFASFSITRPRIKRDAG